MKRILVAGTLAVLLSFPYIALANNCPYGVRTSITENYLTGEIENDHMSPHINSKAKKGKDNKKDKEPLPEESCIVVFDVKEPINSKS